MNSTRGSQLLIRDTFATAFAKNFILVGVWLSLSYINFSVMTTFFSNQTFYEDPRYILFIHMVSNDAVQLTVTVALFVVSYICYTISVSICSAFILVAVFTTHNTPLNLAAMALERYIAVCNPLRHSQICTVRRTHALISLIWFLSVVPDITDLFVTLATEPLNFYSSVFCLRQNVFRDPYSGTSDRLGHKSRGMNSTEVSQARLRDTFDTAFAKNFILVALWISMNYINISVVATFFSRHTFYEDPRYILFIHMVINDAVWLSVSIILSLVLYIFYAINVSVCSAFILVAVFTTHNTPLNLAAMALERYIAVCNPLRHSQICTVRRTHAVIGLIWFLSVVPDITDLFVTFATEPFNFFTKSVPCMRQNIFKDPVLRYKLQAFDGIYFSLVFLTLVYTYLRVLCAARAMSTEKTSAQRARNTILLHGAQLLMCLLSYMSPSVELILVVIFPSNVRYIMYLSIYIMPRFLSPIIYGFRDQTFRKHLMRYFVTVQCKSRTRVENQKEKC